MLRGLLGVNNFKKQIMKTKNVLHLIILLVLITNSSVFAQDTYQEADSLRQQYQNKQSYDTALVYAKQALTLVEKQYGKKDTLYADMLNGLVNIYGYSSRFNKAINFCKKELEIRLKLQGKDNINYGNCIAWLGWLYYNIGDYDKALPLYIEALENIKKSLGKNHSDYGASLNNLAGLYQDIGQYQKALPLYLDAIENGEKSLGKEHFYYGIYLSELAELYGDIGQYQKALPLYLEALENCEKSLGKEHSYYGIYLNELAKTYYLLGNYKKALPLYIDALANVKKSVGENHPEYGIYLNNLALLYQKMGKYQEALPLFIETLENTKKLYGKEHSEYGVRLNNLAGLYLSMEQYGKALPLYRDALKNTAKALGKEHLQYGAILNSLAGLYQKMGQYQQALPIFIEGIENINQNITKDFSYLSEKEKEAYFNMNSFHFKVFNSFALQSKEQLPEVTTMVFDNAVRNKGILLKSSTAMRMTILSSKDTVLINKYDKWIGLKKEIVSLYSNPISKRQKDPKNIEEQANVLERDLVKNSQEFLAFTNILKIKWQDVQKALKSNEVAIEFVHFRLYGKNRFTDTTMYCALIVNPKSKQPEMIPLFREKQLEEIIGKFGGNNYSYINSIYGKNTEVNQELYNLVWAPIDSFLTKRVGVVSSHTDTKLKVYLSPSGLLHKISFSAIAKEQNVYLCDAYSIEVKSSTGKLVESHQMSQRHPMTSATLFGGINYNTDSTQAQIWSYLEGTKIETEKINNILKRGKVGVNYFSNTTATEEEFKLMAKNSNILHIATHGFFYPDPKEIRKEEKQNIEVGEIVFRGGGRGFGVSSFVKNDNPLMRSGLVFAGANDVWSIQNKNDSIDDGVLTAQEVSNIDMRKTDLVVMSACETGLGDIKDSEGVYGLQRAFKMAGVDYMIMSLWQVPDKETEEFMTTFYKKLIKQKDIKQSFAETQKEMRAKYDPYFWAAFVLIK